MKQLQEDKQSILATVSLLSASTGLLDVLALPSEISPDWLVPANLVLEVVPMTDRKAVIDWQYDSRNQEVPVYALIGKNTKPTKLVILESTTDIYRVGILVDSSPIEHSVRISELKDVDESVDNPYCLQPVMLDGQLHIVPDLDKLSHKLVDLD